jgi:hypothetical protein
MTPWKSHKCPHSREWTHCMERAVVCPCIKSFIISRSLHDLWKPSHVKINSTQEILDMNVISRLIAPLLKSTSIGGFKKGTTLFRWPWGCMTHLSVIWIVSLRSLLIFAMIDDQGIICPCPFAFNFLSNMLILFFNMFYCHNPNLGLTTKVEAYKGEGQKEAW